MSACQASLYFLLSVASGKFLIAGGNTDGWTDLATEVIDLKNNSSNLFEEIPSGRIHAFGGQLGSTSIICGGYGDDTDNSCITLRHYQCGPKSFDTWNKTSVQYRNFRTFAASVALNETTLWIIGGNYAYGCQR